MTITKESFEEIKDTWNESVMCNIRSFKQFHEFWLAESKNLPVYWLRYEDLILRPEEELTKLFCFLLNTKSIEGTVVQARIRAVVQKGARQVYKPRSGKSNVNRDKYSEEQLRLMD